MYKSSVIHQPQQKHGVRFPSPQPSCTVQFNEHALQDLCKDIWTGTVHA